MIRIFRTAVLFSVFTSSVALAQAQKTAEVQVVPSRTMDAFRVQRFDMRLGMGAMTGPGTFLLVGNGEFHFDRFFSVGPQIQLGLGNSKTLFVPTLGGRLSLPLNLSWPFELSVQSGLGMITRRRTGLSFTDYAFEAGMNADVYILQNVTVGIGGILNITGSPTQRTLGSLFASASYRI